MSKRKKIIVGISIAVAFIVVLTAAVYFKKDKSEVYIPPETIELGRQDLKNIISVSGSLESVKKRVITSELTDQKILKLHVSVGDRVREGDIIASLDTAPIEDKLKILKDSVSTAAQKTAVDKNLAVRNLNSTLENSEIEKSRAQDAVSQANSALEKAKSESAQAKSVYEQEKASIQSKEAALSNARKESEDAKTNVQQQEKLTADTKELLELKQAGKPQMEEASARKETELNAASTAYETAKIYFEGIAPDESQAPEVIEAARADMEDKKSLMQAVQADYDSIKSQKQVLEEECSALEVTLSLLKNDLELAVNDYEKKSEAAAGSENALSAGRDAAAAKEGAYKQSDASVAAAGSEYKKSIQSGEDVIRSSTKTYADQQDSLRSIEIAAAGSNIQEKMDIKKYQRQLEDCSVKAMSEGVITSLGVQEGAVYKSGEIATIQDTENFIVTALIDQYDIGKLQEGMPAQIQAAAAGDQIIKGRVSFISPVPKLQTNISGTNESNNASSADYPIEIELSESSRQLRLGMKTKTSIIVSAADNVLAVPYNCIAEDKEGNSVIRILDNQIEKQIKVKTGLETDYFVEIKGKDLKEGMKIIVSADNAEALEEGNSKK